MKIRIVIVIVFGLLSPFVHAVNAKAQDSRCGDFILSSNHGQPGSAVTVSIFDCISNVSVTFDNAYVAEYLVPYGEYCRGSSFNFTIPATASAGSHVLWFGYGGHDHGDGGCAFTVDAATQPAATVPSDAYPETTGTPAILPSTGLMLFLPTAGLLGGGLGMLLLRKRRW